MQRFFKTDCQPDMKNLLPVVVSIILFTACRKENNYVIKARLIANTNICNQNVWLAQIEDPDPKKSSFLCEQSLAPGGLPNYSCRNYVYITNVPTTLATANRLLKFSKWRSDPTCLSAFATPAFLKIADLSGQ